jgi:hypothetical protein
MALSITVSLDGQSWGTKVFASTAEARAELLRLFNRLDGLDYDCDHAYEQRIVTWAENMETYLVTDCAKCGHALDGRILNE